jgi:hypothetical protein
MPTDRETQLRRLAALELLKADMQRRLEDRIAVGKAIRVKLGTVVCTHVADDFIQQREAAELAKLRQGGEAREVVFDYEDTDFHGRPIEQLAVIVTGVPRDEGFGVRNESGSPPSSSDEARE